MVLQGRSARWVSLSLFLLSAFAAPTGFAESPDSVPGVCERHTGRGTLDGVASNHRFRMSFKNEGGLQNGGVCWWHSRFQRAVWTLAEFRPDLPKPNLAEARRLINAVAHLSRVVIIPGYADFESFSADYHSDIQRELNAWQKRDGFINQAWIRGLSGRYDLSKHPEKLRRIMDRLYVYSERGRRENFIPWVMLQLKGIESHAALLTRMTKTEDGYALGIVESNYPDQTIEWKYRYGDGHMEDAEYTTIPYFGLHRDVGKMAFAVGEYCKTSSAF